MLLTGWKSIASYLGAGVRTVQRWEDSGLPVRRPRGKPRGPVLAYTEDLERWVRRRITATHDDAIKRALQTYVQNRQLRGESRTLRRELYRQSRELRDQVEQMRSTFGRPKTKPEEPDPSPGK